jgi:hypothetical protein
VERRQRRVNVIASSSVSRWCVNGVWEKILYHFSEGADCQDVSMDGSVVRAANSSAENEAIGRSKGGFGCKIHSICDASAILADKAYDTNKLREWLESRGIAVVIPPKLNRKEVVSAIIGIIRSGMRSNACSASAITIAELLRDMRKRILISMGVLSLSSVLLWLI